MAEKKETIELQTKATLTISFELFQNNCYTSE